MLASALVLQGFAATPRLTAQDAATSTSTQLKVNVRLVVLDVVVTDTAGRPVEGLTEKDFQVFEDGKPQRIQSVERSSSRTLPSASIAAGMLQSFDPAQPISFGQSPVNILILDQLNTHFEDSSFARRSLHDYLAGQPALLAQPTTLLNVYDNHFIPLQEFTRDRDALLRALAAAPVEYAWKLEVNGKTSQGPIERLDQSLRALEQISEGYASIPGRKNLIWVGGGFPSIDPTVLDADDAREIKGAIRHVTDLMLDTRVTLYAVDPSSSAAGMTEITDASQMAFVQAAGDATAGGADPFGATDDFDRLGPATGGRVIRGMNNVARQITSSVDLGSHFYTIAYLPGSASDAAALYRAIKVVCLRPGLTASTRSGYYAGQREQMRSAGTAAYDLTTAAESRIPLHGLRVAVVADNSLGKPDTYLIHVAATNLTWEQRPSGGSTASVDVMAVSLDGKGKMISHVVQRMTATANLDVNLHEPSRMADFILTAPPAPKAAILRFIVRDTESGLMGSMDIPMYPQGSMKK